MKMLIASLPLFRIFGVPVHAHFTWLLYLAGFMIWIGWEEQSYREAAVAGFIIVLLFGSLLIHEYSHVLVARKYGCKTKRILLLPIGCVAQLEEMLRQPHEIWIALAGPLASATLGAVSYLALLPLMHQFGPSSRMMQPIVVLLVSFNFLVAGFNMIPCFPMDGGRVLRSLLASLISWISPRPRADALILATRISVRYVGWPLAAGIIALTCLATHTWMHIVIFSLLIFAGEAEFWLLRDARNQSQESLPPPTPSNRI